MPSEKAYWLLQGEKSHRIPVLIAHSVVNCNSAGDIFPARLLNSRSEAVTLFKGTRIGTLEPLQEDAISGTDAVETLTVNSVLDAMPEMSPEKDQLLQKLVQDIVLLFLRLSKINCICFYRHMEISLQRMTQILAGQNV